MGEFTQDLIAPGVAGIDLQHPNDLIPKTKLSRAKNVARLEEGGVRARPGTESLATGGVDRHTVMRLSESANPTRVWGVDDTLEVGLGGATTQIDDGYSGRPLSLLPYRPALSGEAWLYVGDDNKMRKVRSDGLNLPLGLAAPTAVVTSVLEAEHKTSIETFNSAAGWNPNPGTGGPNAGAFPFPGKVGNSVGYVVQGNVTNPGDPFYSYYGKEFASTLNLNVVGGLPATDDDIIHIWCRFLYPELIAEIKLYLVVSANFDSAWLPGFTNDDEDPNVPNPDAYVKAFRPSDFGPFLVPDVAQSFNPAIPAAQRRVMNRRIEQELDIDPDARTGVVELRRQMREGRRIRADQIITPKLAWTELGVLGVPFRRGDFLRIGTDESRSWATVTGIFVLVEVTTGFAPPPAPPETSTPYVLMQLDDLYLVGGRGPDTMDPGQAQYDYRCRNIDITTGDVSNPSPIQPEAAFKDARRQGINVTPPAYANPEFPAGQLGNIRQEIYRRGGSLVENWYLAGTNASNGGVFLDTLSDSALQLAPLLEIDNFQPVHTLDAAGNEIDAVPLPSIWGPVQNLIMGCGDPNRPGHVYWCKPGFPGSWPANNSAEVTAPSDPLQAGWFIAGRSLVFSTETLFDLLIDLTGNGILTPIPTQCSRGLVGRRGYVVHRGSCYFLAKDGVFRTAGGPEEDITMDLWPLFHADVEILADGKNGFFPIDRSFPDAIRMACFDDQIWLWFRDVRGQIACWVFSTTYNYWLPYQFPQNITNGTQDDGVGERTFVLGSTEGESFIHAGAEDDGQPIACSFRTGSLDQGMPREYKLYGDMVIDMDRAQHPITVSALLDNESRSPGSSPQVIGYESLEQFAPVGGGRQRYTLDLFGITSPLATSKGRNVSLEVSWDSDASGQPRIFTLGPSYIIQPDVTIYRPTDWDFGGRLTDKWIKGVSVEVDVLGRPKQVNVEADDQVIATFSIPSAAGRRVYEFAFPQVMGRLLRLHPADNTPWMLYKYDWIFDEEPLHLTRWETQEVDHGIPGWHYPLWAWITLRATADVTLTIQPYREAGSPINTPVLQSYVIPATGFIKRKSFVPFQAEKGMLFKYIFTSPQSFHLHREESSVIVQPWGGSDAVEVRPFGNDDLSEYSRAMRSARLTAAKGGGGQ